MRRQFAAALCALALLLAGCQAPAIGGSSAETPTEAGQSTPDEVVTLEVRNGTLTETGGAEARVPDDPETDRLGWEGGYWHNESLDIDRSDGLNQSERAAVVNRSMARVEYIRGLEFNESVPVEVISREQYRENSSGEHGPALRAFDNAKFEALFLIGEDEDSIAVQESTLGSSVLGYYSPSEDAIVIVSDSETPTIAEGTLGHELVHALQDQRFGLNSTARTRDGVQGRNGLIEGDASTVDDIYGERCGEAWDCLNGSGGGGGGSGDRHAGISFMLFFPYSDGTTFVSALRDRGGWDAVDGAYADLPDGAREVTHPEDYPEWEPRAVTMPAEPGGEWERVRPSADRDRPDYATVGPSAIAAAMAYTLSDEYNRSAVVTSRAILNYGEDGNVDSADPYNYDLPATQEGEGGRMHVYTNGTEQGYVWRTVWTDAAAAERFAERWGDVVEHWGGTRTGADTWVIADDSPFTDAVAIHVEGDTVTVVNAPTESQLSELYDA
jgi:hypothetical protein